MDEFGGLSGVLALVANGVGFGVVVFRGRGSVLWWRVAKCSAQVSSYISSKVSELESAKVEGAGSKG